MPFLTPGCLVIGSGISLLPILACHRHGSGNGNSIWTNAGVGQDTIHVTDRYYDNLPNRVLIHELVHVWQATNQGVTGIAYKLNSLMHQTYHILRGNGRDAAYDYDKKLLGTACWYSFSTEEQAQLVEDWFHDGNELESDPAFPYIHWHIRMKSNAKLPASVGPPDVPDEALEQQREILEHR